MTLNLIEKYPLSNSCGGSGLTQRINYQALGYTDNEYPSTRKWCYIAEIVFFIAIAVLFSNLSLYF